MKSQLLDVTIIIAQVSKSHEDEEYATTKIIRADLESENLDKFIECIQDACVNTDWLKNPS